MGKRSIFDRVNEKRGLGKAAHVAVPVLQGPAVALERREYVAGEVVRGVSERPGARVRLTCVVTTRVEIFESAGSGGSTRGYYKELDNAGSVGHEARTVVDIATASDDRGAFALRLPVTAPPSIPAYKKSSRVAVAGSNRDVEATVFYAVFVQGSEKHAAFKVSGSVYPSAVAASGGVIGRIPAAEATRTTCEVRLRGFFCVPVGTVALSAALSAREVCGTDAPLVSYRAANGTRHALALTLRLMQTVTIQAQREIYVTDVVLAAVPLLPLVPPRAVVQAQATFQLPGARSMAMYMSVDTPTLKIQHRLELLGRTRPRVGPLMRPIVASNRATLRLHPLTVGRISHRPLATSQGQSTTALSQKGLLGDNEPPTPHADVTNSPDPLLRSTIAAASDTKGPGAAAQSSSSSSSSAAAATFIPMATANLVPIVQT